MAGDALGLLEDEPSRFVVNNEVPSDEAAKVFTRFRDGALAAYLERTAYARESLESLKKQGAKILNDHVALRSFKDANGNGGRAALEPILLAFGYRKENDIPIDALHLDCTWYEPPESTSWPKVFISEQQVERLPEEAQEIVYRTIGTYYADTPTADLGLDKPEEVDPEALVSMMENPPWNLSSKEYDRLLALAEEEPDHKRALQFTSWTLVHGHRWNHLTILQNTLGLEGIDNLEALNAHLTESGFPMNETKGKTIQGSAEVLLKQSSTTANQVSHAFSDGVTREVPGSFVEFIERFMKDDEPFRGFLAANAQGIFSSTDAKK